MSWRILVIRSRAKLDLQLGYLCVRSMETKKVFLSEIGVLLIESTAVSLTAALLAELVRRNIKVVFCDPRHNPAAELLPYYGNARSCRQLREQIAWSGERKAEVWAEIVRAKILMQAELLKRTGREAAQLLVYAGEVAPGDPTNREAQAARIYFPALFGESFSRDRICNVNAALNYGYTILLSACNREITAAGYLTQLGIHHDNQFNPFNFASDLIEPLRPFVDATVCEMHTEGALTHFQGKEKVRLIESLTRNVRYREQSQALPDAIGHYAYSVFAALQEGTDIKYCRFEEKGA